MRSAAMLHAKTMVVDAILQDDLRYARPVTYDEWRARGLRARLFEWFAFPVKSQL